jgi:hypothetical protein
MSWYHATICNRAVRPGRLGSAVAAAILALSVLAASASAAPASPPDASANYAFMTLNNPADTTFNQLLGINEAGLIAGYYGSGMAGHPNKGYLLPNDGAGAYENENFPGAAQTQVTGLNNVGVTVGFWADKKGDNSGFYTTGGHHFHTADYPTNIPASPAVDQLLGVNDKGIAVGFYNDSKGNAHGYTYNIATHRYGKVAISGATSLTSAAINNQNDIAGFETNSGGTVEGFLLLSNGKLITLSVPGSSMTQAFGVNDGDEVVGDYQVGTGKSAMTHGFIWAPGFGFQNVDDPSGIGATTVNGVNDHGRLVGFYTDSAGNTDGFLATPQD